MKHPFVCLCSLWLLVAAPVLGQEPFPAGSDLETRIVNRFFGQLQNYPEEKLYLHTDKPYYSAGDTLWFKAYLQHAATHQALHLSRYVYVELINESNQVSTRVRVRPEDDLYYCQIPLPADIAPGQYSLRAYTNYMRNLPEEYFFRKEIYIGNVINSRTSDSQGEILDAPARQSGSHSQTSGFRDDADFDVQFLPEGGHLICGARQTVAFKAIDREGWGTDIHGTVTDQDNNEVTSFSSTHLGMGSFCLYTEPGKQYTAHCETLMGEQLDIPLPLPTDSTCALSLVQRNGVLRISVLTPNSSVLTQNLHLILHLRGIPLFKKTIVPEEPYAAISLQALPAGIVQVLLIDDEGRLLSERLTFVRQKDASRADITLDKPYYGKRERVTAHLSVADAQGQPLSGNYSVSVTDDRSVRQDTSATTIESYFLLTSDLKGYIEQPGNYFRPGNRRADEQLDLLMLTQGWRRYDIPKLLHDEPDPLDRHELEAGSFLCGKLQTYPIRRAIPNNNISVFNAKYGYVNAVLTDNRGRFCVEGFEFADSSAFFLQADKKQQGVIMELVIDPQEYPGVSIPNRIPREEVPAATMERFLHNSRDRYFYENGSMVINLAEVSVTAQKTDELRRDRGALYTYASFTFDGEEIEQMGGVSLLDILLQAPGVTLNSSGDGVLIRNATPLVVIDNVTASMSELSTIQPFDVEMIDILKDPAQTAMYQGGGNGVICIYLKRGQKNQEVELGSHQKVVPYWGYTSARTFYQPMYSVDKFRNSTTPDLRTTLFWQPDVRTADDGTADIRFYTADEKGTYTLILEGISDRGDVVRCVKTIERK